MTIEERLSDLEQRIQKLEKKQPVKKFVKPTRQEVYEKMEKSLSKIGMNAPSYVDIQTDLFMNHYTANGWKVGNAPMKSWEAAISGTWISNIKNKRFGKDNSGNNRNNIPGNGGNGEGGFGKF